MKKAMKTYHGIPKSRPNSDTLFYCDFDGTLQPQVGAFMGDVENSAPVFESSPTGYGVKSVWGRLPYRVSLPTTGCITIDFWFSKVPDGRRIIGLGTPSNTEFVRVSAFNNLLYLGSGSFSIDNSKQKEGFNHCRLVVDYDNAKITSYFNGTLLKKENIQASLTEITHVFLFDYKKDGSKSDVIVSDLHISKGDLGNTFFNIPEDFINGSAVIKPRFGQQQIHKDPMLSQSVRVTINPNDPKQWVSVTPTRYINVKYPEIEVSRLPLVQGSTLKVSAQSESNTVGGVVDKDTALAWITKDQDSPVTVLDLNDVSGLSVNDVIRVWDTLGNGGSTELTITAVDTSNKTITLNKPVQFGNSQQWSVKQGRHCIVEVTSSSSAPVIKTNDGANVVGYWTTLGTKSCTFTLQENPSLSGKTITINYSLNAPYENSQFRKVPLDVLRGYTETGLEVKPVNNMFIIDDFLGKSQGDYSACPHWASFKAFGSSAVFLPEQFTPDSYIPYEMVAKNDYNSVGLGNTTNGNIARVLVSFDIVKMVESKIGTIPSANKVQWLKDNLNSIARIYVKDYGAGSDGSGGTKYNIQHYWYSPTTKTYDVAPSHSNNELTVTTNQTSVFTERIDNNGFVYFLLEAPPSDGTVTSVVQFGYAKLEISLKMDSNYTYLFCSNERAREDMCNPIVIQKNTKEVRRYVPSRENFTTECLYFQPNRCSGGEDPNYIYRDEYLYSTTLGSGAIPKSSSIYKNVSNFVAENGGVYVKPSLLCGDSLETAPITGEATVFTSQLSNDYVSSYWGILPKTAYPVPKYVSLKPYLVKNQGELRLQVYSVSMTNSGRRVESEKFCIFTLPNTPLEK